MLCAAGDDVELCQKCIWSFIYVQLKKTLCLGNRHQCLTVLVEGTFCTTVVACLIHIQCIIGKVDSFSVIERFVAIPPDTNLITYVHSTLNLCPAH